MTNYLKVNHERKTLVMDKTFAKNASIFGSRESMMLEDARRAYPEYSVARRQIKKNTSQERYNGLTYDYMKRYIETHEEEETRKAVLEQFNELLIVSKCHSKGKRYPAIKKWFLESYPEVKMFGMSKEQLDTFKKEQEEKNFSMEVLSTANAKEEKKAS